MRKVLLAAIIFGFGAGVGLSTYESKWNTIALVSPSDTGRTVANIDASYDFSRLEGVALNSASQERLVEVAKVFEENGDVGIILGHFVTRNGFGDPVMACSLYDKIEIVFYASGMAVNGAPSQMVVSGRCEVGEDLNLINPIWISVSKLFHGMPRSEELTDPVFPTTELKFVNMGMAWPVDWYVHSVRLKDSDERTDDLFIDATALRRIHPVLLSFSWPKN